MILPPGARAILMAAAATARALTGDDERLLELQRSKVLDQAAQEVKQKYPLFFKE
jgi:hypothetical protein